MQVIENVKEQLFGKKITAEDREKMNMEFISQIAPIGGLDFTSEKFVSSGSGYEVCLFIYSYPKLVSTHWLSLITNIEDTISVIDIASASTGEVKQNLKRSLEEQNSRYRTAKNDAEMIDAQQQYSEIEEMYKEISAFGEIMKKVVARIYIPAKTLYDVENKLKEVIKSLESAGFKAGVCLNEAKSDFRNAFLSYYQQQGSIYGRKGQDILARPLAAGIPFHFSDLSDPFGTYLGETITGGAVMLDIFASTKQRMSYDFLCVGKKGAGKSTTLKKLLLDRATRNDLIRVFDIDGEFTMLTEMLGGKVIYLDGQSDSIINILQILPNDENQTIAFENHLSKVGVIYNYLKGGKATENELLILKQLLRVLYCNSKICDSRGNLICDLKELESEDFPTVADLLGLTKFVIENYNNEAFSEKIFEFTNVRENKLPILEDIELKLNDLCTTHGKVFNGHTSVEDFYSEKVVCFNLKNLTKKEEAVFDAQLYNALTICWDNCVAVGSEMKSLVREGQIKPEDVVHSLILIDEAHKTINANKTAGIDEIMRIVREARKYFGAIGLASQSIRDFVPDNASAVAVDKMKTLFELTTYKFIMQQDSNAIPKLQEIFQNTFSKSEVENIPTLERGECIMSISGDRNIQCYVKITDDEQYIFDGGV